MVVGGSLAAAATPAFASPSVPSSAAAGPSASAGAGPSADGLGSDLVDNGGFENGTRGWRAKTPDRVRLKAVAGARSGRAAARITTTRKGRIELRDRSATVKRASGKTYVVSSWVKGDRVLNGSMKVVERNSSRVVRTSRSFTTSPSNWRSAKLAVRPRLANSSLQVRFVVPQAKKGAVLRVDDVSLRRVIPVSAPRPPSTCAIGQRGLQPVGCKPFVGASVGLNQDPTVFESQVGGRLGIRRTYYQAGQVSKAVSTAKTDLAKGRLPWISFKLPASWDAMAKGSGDAWARDIAKRLAELDGPVWVAFHHEPELDGDIALWTRIQDRLAPIVRSTAPNVAYTIILTGWHQTGGQVSKYGLDKLWPDTKVDLVGFDLYNYYGTPGSGRTSSIDMGTSYFQPLATWAKKKGVRWGVGELGYTDRAAAETPGWLMDTYEDMLRHGGSAMAYFNSAPTSATGDWLLDTPARRKAFADVRKRSSFLQ